MKILQISAGVRYWEDSKIDGVADIDYDTAKAGEQPKMPLARKVGDEYRWCIDINAETGIIQNWPAGVTADIHYKVCDDCEIDYYDTETGTIACNNNGYWYCPDFLCPTTEGFGDYIIFKIDGNGHIDHWNPNLVTDWCLTQQDRDDDGED